MKQHLRLIYFLLIVTVSCDNQPKRFDNSQQTPQDSSSNNKREYNGQRVRWYKDKSLIRDSLLIDSLGNLYLCGEFTAYATGNLIHFKPRIDDYVIELKYLVDTATFKQLEYPVFRDKNYFYSYFKMADGGTVTAYEANKKSELQFETYIDSLKRSKTSH